MGYDPPNNNYNMATTTSRSKSRPATKRVSRKSAAVVEEVVVNAPPSPSPVPVRVATPARSSARKVAAAPAKTSAPVNFFSDEIYASVKHFLTSLIPALLLITLWDHFALVSKYVEPTFKAKFGEKGQVGAILGAIHVINFVILPLLVESYQAGKQLPECPSLMSGPSHRVYNYQNGVAQLLGALVSAILTAVLKQTPYTFIFSKTFQTDIFLALGWASVWCGCAWWRSFTRTGAAICILHLFYLALAKQ